MRTEEFLSYWRSHRQCSPRTVRAYRSDLKLFQQFLCEAQLLDTDVTPVVISQFETWMETRPNPRFQRYGLKDASIKRRMAAVKSYYKFLRLAGDCNMRDPFGGLTRNRRMNRTPKPVPDAVRDQLESGITDIRDKALYALLFASGLRVDEVHQLDMEGITVITEEDKFGKKHRVGTGTVIGKGNKERRFFFDEAAFEVLKDYLLTRTDSNAALFLSERKQRLSIRAIQRNLQAWCKKLGLPHINVHRTRHSYATELANASIDIMVLMELLGHSDPSTTRNYYDLDKATLAREYFAAKARRR
jgi:site-specific recombinase XerC